MRGTVFILLPMWVLFGAFSSSPHYDLNNYSLGGGATNSAHSTTYYTQGDIGQQGNGKENSTSKNGNPTSIGAEQLGIPQAPTVSNESSLDYNKLLITLNDNNGTNNYPTDTTFAIEVSTNSGFTAGSTFFLQTDGSLNSSEVFQTYTLWGGASGTHIIGLAPNTPYWARVTAQEGQFTNTVFGPAGTATTASPSLSFSVSPSTLTLANLLPSSIITSSNLTFGYSTNGANGGAVYVSGSNGGLFSTHANHLIAAYSGNLSTPTEGFGVQDSSATETSGGPFTIISPYNGTGNTVGSESAVPTQMLTSSSWITGGSATANVQAKASANTPAANDYAEVLTFIASGAF